MKYNSNGKYLVLWVGDLLKEKDDIGNYKEAKKNSLQPQEKGIKGQKRVIEGSTWGITKKLKTLQPHEINNCLCHHKIMKSHCCLMCTVVCFRSDPR